jgi:PPM family protein phosphatase
MKGLITGTYFDIGNREIYEDRLAVTQLTTRGGLELTIALVADGVGGANRGERAAQLAVDVVLHYLTEVGTSRSIPQLLRHAFMAANDAVCAEAAQIAGGSTTLAAAVVHNGRLFIANVGDSRIYLCRNGKLNQLTVDHTFAEVMPQLGKMSIAAAAANPRADVLVRYVGSSTHFTADLGFYVGTKDPQVAEERGRKGLPLKPGDAVLLCSDGLVKTDASGQPFTSRDEIIRVLQTQEGDKAARSLVSFALGRKADDNVSVILLQTPDPKRRRRARRPFIRAFLLVTLLFLIGFLALYYIYQQEIKKIQGNFSSQQDAIAQEATAAVNAVAATATADLAAFQTDAAATAAAVAAQQADANATAVAFQTRAADQLACSLSGSYDYRINDLQLTPKPIYRHVIGNRLPADFALELRWSLTNTGLCPLPAPILHSPVTGVPKLAPQWEQADQLLELLPPGETANLHITLPANDERSLIIWRDYFTNSDVKWWFTITPAGEANPINLLARTPLTLRDGSDVNWLQLVSPTAIPLPTPTLTSTQTTPAAQGINGNTITPNSTP